MEEKKLIVNDILQARFSEAIEIQNDNFLFEIYRERETILLINDEPSGITWHDNGPSSVHYYALNGSNIDPKTKQQLKAFENLVQDQLPEDYPLSTLFEIYKPLLKSGIYRLFYSPAHSYEVQKFRSTRQLKPFNLHLPQQKEDFRPSLYLEAGIFMFAQSLDTINPERVSYYEKQIQSGKQPIIVSLGMQPNDELPNDVYSQFMEAYPQFIIDGHHKSMAYHNLNTQSSKAGAPYEVLVPGVFHIVRIPNEAFDPTWTRAKRTEVLAKMLSKEEIALLYECYDNW